MAECDNRLKERCKFEGKDVCGTYANALSANKTVLTAVWSQTSHYYITYGTPCVSVSARTNFLQTKAITVPIYEKLASTENSSPGSKSRSSAMWIRKKSHICIFCPLMRQLQFKWMKCFLLQEIVNCASAYFKSNWVASQHSSTSTPAPQCIYTFK